MPEPDTDDAALKAANQALSRLKHRESARFASIELRAPDRRVEAWELLALVSVGVAAFLVVLALWFL